jgi:hypothetical protein
LPGAAGGAVDLVEHDEGAEAGGAREAFREATLDGAGVPRIVRADLSGGLGALLLLASPHPGPPVARRHPPRRGTGRPEAADRRRTRETDNDGARQGAHNLPGSGSIDFQLGLAYSLVVDWLELDADIIGRVRTEGAMSYQAGNMLQADVALSATVWQLTFVAELDFLVSERDVERDEVLRNSCVATLYASPGVVARLTNERVLFASFSYPILQDLPGIQNYEAFRANFGYMFSAAVSGTHADEHQHAPDADHRHDGHPHEHADDASTHQIEQTTAEHSTAP